MLLLLYVRHAVHLFADLVPFCLACSQNRVSATWATAMCMLTPDKAQM